MQRLRESAVQYTLLTRAQTCDDTSLRIDDCGNTGIRGAHHGKSLFNRAQPRSQEVLVGTDRRWRTEPRIVGDVDQPARPRNTDRRRGEQNLVADQRTGGRRARYGDRAWTVSRREIAGTVDQLGNS